MKKILFMAAATAVALSSCSKDETVGTPANEQKEISFNTYVGNTTKADYESTGELKDASFDSFAVNAEYDSSSNGDGSSLVEYFTTGVTRSSEVSSNAWITTNTFFWPTSGYLTFYAYNNDMGTVVTSIFDKVSGGDSTTGESNKIDFASTTGLDDLVVAYKKVAAPTNHATDATAVGLDFTHALTKVHVKLAGDVTAVIGSENDMDPAVDQADDYKFEITSLTLNGYASGTYTWATTPTFAESGTAINMEYESAKSTTEVSDVIPNEIIGNGDTDDLITEYFMLIPESAATFTVAYNVYHKADGGSSDTWVKIAEHTGDDAKTVAITTAAISVNTLYTLSLPIDGKPVTFTGSSLGEWSASTPATGKPANK